MPVVLICCDLASKFLIGQTLSFEILRKFSHSKKTKRVILKDSET